MVAAVAPFIDTSISKTVNVPEDYPYADFEDLYLKAWKSGLKGLATYRPNTVLGSVSARPTPPKPQDFVQRRREPPHHDQDACPSRCSPACAGRGARSFPAGNLAWTYMIESPVGRFALFVGQVGERRARSRSRCG